MPCENKVAQYIPKGMGWTFKEVLTPCGATGIHGAQLLCESCEKKAARRYPQRWRDVPGDVCPHGVYVGDRGGPDYMCPKCEDAQRWED